MANLSNINDIFKFTDGEFLLIGGATANSISGTETGIAISNSNAASLSLQNTTSPEGNNFTLFSNSDGSFIIRDVGVLDRFSIDKDGDSTFAGIIGVNGSTNANIPITATTSSGYEDVAYFKSTGTNINSRINLFPTGTGSGAINSTANNLLLQTSGTTALTINSSQNAIFAGVIFANRTLEVLGQNLTHGASRIKICQENTTKSQVRYYGADASTKGILEFMSTTSDGTASFTPLTLNADGSATFTGSVTATNFIGTLPTGQFLPLTGGTLTGDLVGTNVAIGGAIVANRKLAIYNTNADNELQFIGTDFTNIYSETDSTMAVEVIGDGALKLATKGGNLTIATGGSSTFTGSITSGIGNNFDPIIREGRVVATPAYSFTGDLDTGMFNPNLSNTIAFGTGGVERLRIDSDGNATFTGKITVGNSGTSRFTDTSAFPLQINRGLDVDTVGANGAFLSMGSLKGTTYIDAIRMSGGLAVNGTDGTYTLQTLGDSTYTTALTIDSDQDATFAGAGTFGDAVRINGTTTTGLVIASSSSASNGLKLYNDSVNDNAYIYNHFSGNLEIGTSNATLLTMNGVSVGIGIAPASSRRLLIKGLGTTSATASFQVNDGDNQDVFLIKDDKSASFTGTVTAPRIGIPSSNASFALYNNSNSYFNGAVTVDSTFTQSGGADSTFSGDVGIGNTTPTSKLDVTSDSAANAVTLRLRSSQDYAFFNWRDTSGTELLAEQFIQRTAAKTAIMKYTIADNSSSPATYLTIAANGNASFAKNVGIGNTEPQTTFHTGPTINVDPSFSGNVLTSNFFAHGGNNGGGSIFQSGTAAQNIILFGNTSSTTAIQFFHSNISNSQTAVGSITTSSSATTYGSASDYRLKENLQDFEGLDIVSKISIYDFKWKIDESRSYGVMAHELQEILPQAVVGEKDAKEMQQVDYSKIVPLLVKSIQEQQKQIKELQDKSCTCNNCNCDK